jgi:hypothetical protein
LTATFLAFVTGMYTKPPQHRSLLMANIMDMMASLPRDNMAKTCRRSRRRMEDTDSNLKRKKLTYYNPMNITCKFGINLFINNL